MNMAIRQHGNGISAKGSGEWTAPNGQAARVCILVFIPNSFFKLLVVG